MHIIPDTDLRRLTQAMLLAAGTPPDIALLVTNSLLTANLMGHDSHGVMRVPQYIRMIQQGIIQPAARASVVAQRGSTAQVDGAWGWGPPGARLAAETAIELARAHGVGAVTLYRGNHVGRLGEYPTMIAQAGRAGIVFANIGPAVAPFGGRQRLMGTNPMAWAVPRAPNHEPIVLDFATSVLAEGKVRVALDKGQTVPPGVILDRDGRPSQQPADFYADGFLLPFGGHKGFGLSVMIELIGGILSGLGPSPLPGYVKGNGTMMIALDIESFVPMETFLMQTEAYCAMLKAAPTVEGVDEVLLPGEPEQRARARRLAEGIPLPDETWRKLQETAAELGVQ
jgi:LDH2 family malate/lactate/ureidoglycolate dehydrogenase